MGFYKSIHPTNSKWSVGCMLLCDYIFIFQIQICLGNDFLNMLQLFYGHNP